MEVLDQLLLKQAREKAEKAGDEYMLKILDGMKGSLRQADRDILQFYVFGFGKSDD